MQREWSCPTKRVGPFALFQVSGHAGRHFFVVIGIVETGPLLLLLIPPDKFLPLAPGLTVGARRCTVVDDAAVIRPGESPAVTKQVFRIALERPISICFRIDAAVDPSAACG